MNILLEFIIVFIILYILNYLFFKEPKTKKKKKNIRPEIEYLINLYQLDIKKIGYNNLKKQCIFMNALIMSSIYIIVCYLVKGFVFQILIGFVLLILLIIIGYGLLGRYYKKRGDKNV